MIIMLGVRILQFLFAATVLALSIILIKDFGPGRAPALEGYSAFCGGAGLLINLVGFAAIFFEPLQGVIMLALDGIALFFTLAGGIAITAVIKVGSCTDLLYLDRNEGVLVPSREKNFDSVKDALNNLTYRCRMTQADTAILWFLFATFAATSALHFTSKRGRGGSYV